MTLFTCVMAWATDAHVSTIADLNAKLADASVETIYLDADLTYAGEACINILRSVTIDGQGHTLSGQGIRTGSTYSSLAINQGAPNNANWIDSVALKNLTIKNTRSSGQALNVRCNLSALLIDKCDIVTTNAGGNSQPITFGGNQSTPVRFYVYDSKVTANTSGYPVITFNPIALETKNTTYTGYCGLYFKGVSSSAGSRGSVVNADACNFECPNVHSGVSNAFSCFPIADDGITLNLHNCGINNQQIGDQNQALVTIGNDGLGSNRHAQAINITISGDNSHINVGGGMNKTFQNLWGYNTSGYPSKDYNDFADINVTITGGTYSVHPQSADMAAYGHWNIEDDQIKTVNLIIPTILPTDTVLEISQGDITLYRVVKKATTKTVGEDEVLYNLNELVVGEGVSEGVNPTSSFAVIDSIVLANSTTQAGYVVVGDTTTTGIMDSITVTVPENKTFVIKNGLDVKENAKVVAEPQSTIVIGEGGIITDNEESIIIEANENGGASLLLHPSITVNQTPELTIHMVVPAEHAGYEMNGSDKYRHWHRFAMPVEHMDATWVKNPNVATYLYGWDYSAQTWAQVGVTEMVPFAGYTLSPDRLITNETGAITYIFKGKLLGNTNCTLNLNHHGYNFFGNSYTGYISILKLVDQIMGDAKIDGTVWMWNGEKYEGIGLEYLRQYENVPGMIKSWQKEVAPMQTFVLRLTGSELSSTDINYADAIWGNPRYENATAVATPSAAPTRHTQINDNAIISLSIAANGQKESIVLLENDDYSDAYDRGYDAVKYMNDNSFNSYVDVNGENYSTVATDNLEGKMLSINTNNELAYTMTFDFVAGEEYAIRDNVTGKVIAIEEGASYEFAAQPNSTVEGRFEIVAVAKMPTAIENTEVKANVKGIYTIMGQYLGEDFDILPAGVYVVNGVKIVK